MNESLDSFGTRSNLTVGGETIAYFDLPKIETRGIGSIQRLPYCLKILLENLLRLEDGVTVRKEDIEALVQWDPLQTPQREIAFTPARVLLQDFTGVPAVVDLAVMRDAMAKMGGDPSRINPLVPAELVIDHSVQIDAFGTAQAFLHNLEREFERNQERYAFLRWGQSAFDNFRVVPPGTGIVHQVNLEYLARVIFKAELGDGWVAYPDTLVGTDSHTTMINGLGVLGWGVGGIEAEAAMLGQAISLLIPQVVGFMLHGQLREGATATDLVLTVTEMLRERGVVGKFVEFYGPGISTLSLADRATLGNMSPEFGSTCAMFPIDGQTTSYLRLSARDPLQIELVEAYAKTQGLYHTQDSPEAEYSDTLSLELESVVPSLAGPKRPQDRIPLSRAKEAFKRDLETTFSNLVGLGGGTVDSQEGAVAVAPALRKARVRVEGDDNRGQTAEFDLVDGSVVIAAITSCTNTSNPAVMVGAGLLARNAVREGLKRHPWVKTSLAPGSKVVTDYLEKAGLMGDLEALGFNLVGYGCTTCIGNSGPLPQPIADAIGEHSLVTCSVLSGNRNFEGRINPHTRANYLASPPLVVAYALAGRMDVDLYNEPLGQGSEGNDVYLRDIWPSHEEIQDVVRSSIDREMFASKYADVFLGSEEWRALPIPEGDRFDWQDDSTYIRKPTFFDDMSAEPEPLSDLTGLRCLALLGDSVTTDHISPAGSIPKDGPAGRYLVAGGIPRRDFNSFGSRRGNHEVMVRGTFANIRLRNLLVPGIEGGFTRRGEEGDPTSIFEASMECQSEGAALIVIAGKEYGTGSSRDWAAKGTLLLGVRAVIAESYERIHRSNLIGMGVLPLQFENGEGREALGLTGFEIYDIHGIDDELEPHRKLNVIARAPDGSETTFSVLTRIDTPNEVNYYRHGGILHFVLRSLRDGS